MSMTIGENAQMALTTLRENKMRSFLTVLGVVIGITALLSVQQQPAPPKENAGAVSEKAPPDAVGRMGVYDKGLILKSWKKAIESYAKLEAEVNEKQKGIDALSETVQKEKDDYDKAKPGLSTPSTKAGAGLASTTLVSGVTLTPPPTPAVDYATLATI